MMHLKLFSFAALATLASAQTITQLLSSTPELSSLTSLVTQFPDLVKSLAAAKNVTILAPNNAAVDALLKSSPNNIIKDNPKVVEAVLTYHVLQGTVPASAFTTTPAFIPTALTSPDYTNVTGGQVVEGVLKGKTIEIVTGLGGLSTVVKGDIKFDGGLVHIIDRVLTVPLPISVTARAAGLIGVVTALEAVNLIKTIDTESDLTVFAPNVAAFQKVSAQLSKLTAAQAAQVLGYHVVKGTVGYSSKLKNGQTLTTTTGQKVTITISGGNVFVNDAKVLVPDVLVSNGVVHVIDSVLSSNSSQPAGGSNSTSGAGTPVASGAPGGASGSPVSSNSPTGSPITPYKGAASSTKAGAVGVTVFCAAAFLLAL